MDNLIGGMICAFVFVAVIVMVIAIADMTKLSEIKADCDNFGYVMLDDVKYSCSKVND